MKASRFLAFVIAITLPVMVCPSTQAEEKISSIEAIVNDSPISTADVSDRVHLARTVLKVAPNADVEKELRQQILQGLIIEELQMSEAKRLGIEISDGEVDGVISRLAPQYGIKAEQFAEWLEKNDLTRATIERQARAQLAWSRVVQIALRPKLEIGSEEVASYKQKLKDEEGVPQYLLAEIFLPIAKDSQEASTQALANKLLDEMASGASFVGLARQFSKSSSAARGGDMGWVKGTDLSKELASWVKLLRPGQVSKPIRTSEGLYLMLMRDQKVSSGEDFSETMVSLKQMVFPLPANPTREDVEKQYNLALKTRTTLNNCNDADDFIAEEKGHTISKNSGNISPTKQKDLPPVIQNGIGTLKTDEVTMPLTSRNGVILLMVCNRSAGKKIPLPTDDEIINILGNSRLELLQQRYLQDLKNSADIDIRHNS